MKSGGAVYIITNKHRTVLYIGVTNNLKRRMYEHRNRSAKGFATKYNCTDLLYFEIFWNIEDAIHRETVLKKWNRSWKMELIKKKNPQLEDLSMSWFDKNGEVIEEF